MRNHVGFCRYPAAPADQRHAVGCEPLKPYPAVTTAEAKRGEEKLYAALQTARQTAQAEHDEEWFSNLNEVFPND